MKQLCVCVERDLFGQNVIANVNMTSPPKVEKREFLHFRGQISCTL